MKTMCAMATERRALSGRGEFWAPGHCRERFLKIDLVISSDVAEILSRLHQIRHQNTLLSEENRKLQSQLDVTEDSLNTQHAELVEWERRNRK